MEIQITARHSHLSEQFQGTIREKVEALQHFGVPLTSIRVILDTETKEMSTVEIVVKALNQVISSRAKAENMGKALDSAVDKAETQLKKLNQKRKDRPSGEKAGETAEPAPEEEY
jgi:putative sigma-54 modulation protein